MLLNGVVTAAYWDGVAECLHSGPTPRGREDSAPRMEVTAVLRSTSASICRILF